MRGKETVYRSPEAIGKLTDENLTSLQERLASAKGPLGGKLRRENSELLKRVTKEVRRRETLGRRSPIVVFDAKQR
ncbi:hypothetical protein HY310_02710 [Candidatus Microgenomates bacterium]|nr:hypothetical protein [Candidatus Microgenomates bacterium]